LVRAAEMMAADRRRIAERTAEELTARAVEYRNMAATATTAVARDALLRLAKRFEDAVATRATGP
jgi:hypothetical protein